MNFIACLIAYPLYLLSLPPLITKFLTNSIKSEEMAYYKLSNTLYFGNTVVNPLIEGEEQRVNNLY